jgi:hypothetical protein
MAAVATITVHPTANSVSLWRLVALADAGLAMGGLVSGQKR